MDKSLRDILAAAVIATRKGNLGWSASGNSKESSVQFHSDTFADVMIQVMRGDATLQSEPKARLLDAHSKIGLTDFQTAPVVTELLDSIGSTDAGKIVNALTAIQKIAGE